MQELPTGSYASMPKGMTHFALACGRHHRPGARSRTLQECLGDPVRPVTFGGGAIVAPPPDPRRSYRSHKLEPHAPCGARHDLDHGGRTSHARAVAGPRCLPFRVARTAHLLPRRGPWRAAAPIHGFPTASWGLVGDLAALVERYRVLTLDMIGFGFSAKPRRFGYSILAQADLFGAFLARESVTGHRLIAHETTGSRWLRRSCWPGGTRTPARPASRRFALPVTAGCFPRRTAPCPVQRLLASPLGPVLARLTRRAHLLRHHAPDLGHASPRTGKN